MKVLVLTCSTGEGHNSCAKYIKEEFDDAKITCDVRDYMDFAGSNASHIAEKIYLDSTKGKGNVFKNIYKLGELYNKTGIISPVYGLNKLIRKKLYDYIVENNYDLMIATHVFPAMGLTAIKKEHVIKFINVATDYECIPFWNETNPDYFVIPSEKLKDRFIEKGIKEEVLLPIGIPVSSRIFSKRGKINLDKDMVLVTSGSMGFGEIKDVIKSLLQEIDCYIYVVCGSNIKLKNELEEIKNPNLQVLGFVDNMPDLIRASKLVVAKPGGLTTTEIAALRKPLVHMMPIPGVENYNATFFASNKMSLKANNINEVVESVRKILASTELQEEIINNQKKYINKNSGKDLVVFVKKNMMIGEKI